MSSGATGEVVIAALFVLSITVAVGCGQGTIDLLPLSPRDAGGPPAAAPPAPPPPPTRAAPPPPRRG